MAGFTFPPGDNTIPAYVDSGQAASSRLASWMAWTADPNPLAGIKQTVIIRDDRFQPILDQSSNGATSGGDNAIFGNI